MHATYCRTLPQIYWRKKQIFSYGLKEWSASRNIIYTYIPSIHIAYRPTCRTNSQIAVRTTGGQQDSCQQLHSYSLLSRIPVDSLDSLRPISAVKCPQWGEMHTVVDGKAMKKCGKDKTWKKQFPVLFVVNAFIIASELFCGSVIPFFFFFWKHCV